VTTTDRPACWCGNEDLVAFGPGYLRCPVCETLVAARMPGPEISRVMDDEQDFYGREYWFSHQEKHLGHPTILDRARTDLPERSLYWLRTVLKYKLPPALVLEVGSGHGGFVAALRWAGFDATGLEISPWVVEFAREAFQVPMLLGPVEDQRIAPASFDVIALMDVLEHLRDPATTMRDCLGLLRPGGILLVQTPCYPEGVSYEEMVARSDRHLEILQPREHLYLFSRRSIRDFFERLGAGHIAFEPALFADYDMFPVVSRVPVVPLPVTDAGRPLNATPAARMVQGLLDLRGELDDVKQRYAESEHDRTMRLTVIHEQGRRLGEIEAERNNLRAEATALHGQLNVSEADRAARLEVIHEQGRRVAEVEAQCHMQLEQIQALMAQRRVLQRTLQMVQGTRAFRLLRRLGRWKFGDLVADESSGSFPAPALPAEVNPKGENPPVGVEGRKR
jgi:SAM-dependent methyltransferase